MMTEKTYEYDVQITSRHDGCDQHVKDSIVQQMHKLSKFHSHIIDGNVIIDKQNSFIKVEVSVRVPGLTITATDEDYNQTKAVDSAIEKAKTQIKKLKSKVVDHRAVTTLPVVETEEITEPDAVE